MTGEPCSNPVQQVLETGKIQGLSNHTMLISRDGSKYSIADSAAPILDAEQVIVGVVLVFRDITAGQRTEAELLKMEKIRSLGGLAGGIAHDFINFLTGIIGNLSLAQLDIDPGNRIYSRLREMEKAALRAKDLTQPFGAVILDLPVYWNTTYLIETFSLQPGTNTNATLQG